MLWTQVYAHSTYAVSQAPVGVFPDTKSEASSKPARYRPKPKKKKSKPKIPSKTKYEAIVGHGDYATKPKHKINFYWCVTGLSLFIQEILKNLILGPLDLATK